MKTKTASFTLQSGAKSLLLSCSCGLIAVLGLPAATPPTKATALTEVVEGNTAFALDLHRRERDQPGNLFFSPYSISTALAMTWAGAKGRTEQEIARVFHFTLPPGDLPRAFGELAERFAQIEKQKHISLRIANSLWCQRDYPFLKPFLDLNRTHLQAELGSVDFDHHTEAAREEINRWIERKTQDRIRELMAPGQVTPVTTLVLCNAVYFKGKWVTQFDPKATATNVFFPRRGQRVTVPMMSGKMKVRSQSPGDLTLLVLPYTGNDLSMVILLPEAVDGLGALEQRLDAKELTSWLAALDQARESEAIVVLPKFKLNCRLNLKDDLAAMGMPSAFKPGADFSGMTSAEKLWISDVVHQAFVDVNEEGTEAAAATAVAMTRSASASHTPLFRVDHPFLFLIRERQTGSILFLGRVVDPTK